MNDNTKPGKIMDGVCFSTEHIYKKGDKEIPYICEAQEFIFLDEMEQPEASFFLYSYLRQDVDCKDDRPLIFNYGGGPGNSSTPLSMWGPKMMDPSFKKCVGPYPEPIDNQDWLIDVADIILIDPPGTGLGRIYQYDKRSKYWGVQPDAVAFIDMFKHWLTKYDRWYSPKYIAGTSYGGFRTAVLSDLLCGGPYYTEQRQYTHGIALNGAILSATALDVDFANINTDTAGVYASMGKTLPTYAAINWHWNFEGKPELQQFVNEAVQFAADELPRAQWLGNAMDPKEKTAFLEKLSYFSGIPAPVLDSFKNYEVPAETFSQIFMNGKRLSMYDGREALTSTEHLGFYEDYADDLTNARGTFLLAPMVRKFYKDFLKINVENEWIEVNFDANAQWTWSSNRSIIQHLDSALRRNPQMYALVYGGMFDLAAVVGANQYAICHSGIDQSRLIVHNDPYSGHGTGSNPASAHEYAQSVRELIAKSC